jgi:hypothetical protein
VYLAALVAVLVQLATQRLIAAVLEHRVKVTLAVLVAMSPGNLRLVAVAVEPEQLAETETVL